MQFRKFPGRWPAVIIVAVLAALSAGCNRVSTETASYEYERAIKAEQAGNLADALKAYQAVGSGEVKGVKPEQVMTNLARVAVAQRKYDIAVQTYTLLAQQHEFAKVNIAPPTAPADMRVVREWIGTFADNKKDGPFYQAEFEADKANQGKIAYKAMDTLVAATGRNKWYSAALALLIFTVVIKVAMTPLTNIQFHSTRKMTAIQPKMKALQEQYKDKPEEINKRVMALYKEEGVNPVGCGATMLIQFPILIALYSVIRLYNFQFREAYFLWVNPHTSALAPGIIGSSLAQPDMILLVLYAISMFLSQKLTVMPSQDQQQRQQQMMMAYMMPIMFLFVLKTFPSAFVLYWLLFNAFTTWQQWKLLKKNPITPPAAPQSPPKAPDAPAGSGPKRTPPKRKK
jgi:YidC/Oxa1 family membrane protein insertase